jgi:hypothetical protein
MYGLRRSDSDGHHAVCRCIRRVAASRSPTLLDQYKHTMRIPCKVTNIISLTYHSQKLFKLLALCYLTIFYHLHTQYNMLCS